MVWRPGSAGKARRFGFLTIAASLSMSCAHVPSMNHAATGSSPAGPYKGQIAVYLEPWDARGVCSVTVTLDNQSGARQGEAWLRLQWLDVERRLVGEHRQRMDPLLPEHHDAKNHALPVLCSRIGRLQVRSAEWHPYPTLDTPVNERVVSIEDVEGSEWRFSWNEEMKLFVGERVTG